MTDRIRTDAELFADWSLGSRTAGEQLIDRHFLAVRRFFLNKTGSEVEDLVQQTFLACLEARTRFKGQASFKTFLLAIARNQLFKHFSKRRTHPLDFEVTSITDLRTSPSGLAARREDSRLLADALRNIPLEAQIILELVYWEGLNTDEVAAVLEVPLNTVYSRLRRAKSHLVRRLEVIAPDRVASVMTDFGSRGRVVEGLEAPGADVELAVNANDPAPRT